MMSTSLPALETYQYTSLQPVDSTFRILKLSSFQGPELKCELLHHSLLSDRHPLYEALSYVWGSDERVECIVLNRKRFWVTDNLYSALKCLQLRDRDRYLWIDAICINQVDKREQGRQVQQMGKIFKLAERVLFWLGKATPEIIALMDVLNQPRKIGADCDLGQLTPDDNRWGDCRTGLRQLLNRQWFTRVWILQETAYAQEATVCCGTLSIPAQEFSRAPSLIGEIPKPHCQAILDIMPGAFRSGSWWGQTRDLCTLIRRFQSSKATDERDKIYALLGMSTSSVDRRSIAIDYQTPTHEVVHKAMTYLVQSTPVSIHEMLNFMNNFVTLHTIYFVPPLGDEEETEFLFPHLQSGSRSGRTEVLEDRSKSIAIVKDPSLFLFERRLERDLEDQETCHSQVVKLMLGAQTSKYSEFQKYDNGLQVIPWGGVEQHVKIVVIHDEKKAVLKAAFQGYGQIVKRLLHVRGGVEARKTLEESALQDALEQEHPQAVQTILYHSIHKRIRSGTYGNALQAASYRGHEAMVKVLLNAGADPNAQGGQYGNALYAALENKHWDVMKMLLDAGADPNTQGGDYGNALQAASLKGSGAVVKMLLDKGADPNAQGGRFGNALQAASLRGHKAVVKLLLDKSADVNTQGGEFGNALQAASLESSGAVVKMLLDKGANPNAQGGQYGNALQAALKNKYWDVMKMLLDAGADPNTQSGDSGNALQAASYRGYEGVVKMLLDKGADPNAQGGYPGNALQAASYRGYEGVVKMLLDKGADPNAQGGRYGNALQAALENKHWDVIKMLLDAGANPNAQGGRYRKALQAASLEGSGAVVKVLLQAWGARQS
ncbi:ankyrin repeat-containing domain protein [Paraphoma chrysanthemicola]|nr:ankyrin repeat-containing domain protein [Paraphoma chrysanthemicola]